MQADSVRTNVAIRIDGPFRDPVSGGMLSRPVRTRDANGGIRENYPVNGDFRKRGRTDARP
jgi:hypothetical protein